MIINKDETRKVDAILVKILEIYPDGQGKLVIEMEHIDSNTGLGTNEFFSWSASLYGIKDPAIGNYTIGACVGSILSSYCDVNGDFDLLNLKGCLLIGFVHYTYSPKHQRYYNNIHDFYPIENLQFSWLGGNE